MKSLQPNSRPNPCPWRTLRKIRQEGRQAIQATMNPAKLPSVKALTFSAILLAASSTAAQTTPDTIFLHGNILTGTHLRANDTSPTPARVAAIAIANGKILAAGTDAGVLKLKGPNTKVVDLNGAFAMPGFNDAHTHIGEAGRTKLSVDLVGVRSLAEMQQRIRTYVAKAKPGEWIQGGGWDHTLWSNDTLPTRTDLDAVTGDHPAIFRRVDGHMAVANSAALAAAGITSATPDPSGSKIDRDASGNPTGILREGGAHALVYRKIPPPSLEQRRQALDVAIADALSNGVTSVQDNSDWEDFLALEELEHTGKLHLRVAEWLAFDTSLAVLKERRASHPADDPLLHLTQLKGFMDGSLGSRTAAMEEPYSDDPGNSGLARYQQDKLNQMAAERAMAGFQLGFHAIGDRANAMALNAFGVADQVANYQPTAPEQGRNANIVTRTESNTPPPPGALRFRVEHAQVLLPGDFDRFEKEGVIASMQPSHLLTDMKWATDRLGPERARYAYAWKTFLDHHVVLAFGTDYPVEFINPFRGLYSAVTRMNEAGTQTFQPQEKISLNEAIYAYTQASAFGEFRENVKGRLEPSYLADLIILDRDITTASPQQLLHTKVLRTVVNGETVYTASPSKTGAKK
jgi:predicted amidohydrolase YtcJ